VKPNDHRGLELMDHAAVDLMREFPDIIIGFGQSDEFSFLLRKSTTLYNRRRSKITSILCSYFTASYMMNWKTYFPDTSLRRTIPSFDARIILYPGIREVRDYFSWRQADTHVNNLYNTAFWALVQHGGQSKKDAHESLRGTNSGQKHEILYSKFGINYSAQPRRFRTGSVLIREQVNASSNPSSIRLSVNHPTTQLSNGEIDASVISLEDTSGTNPYGTPALNGVSIGSEDDVVSPRVRGNHRTRQESTRIALQHCDIIKEDFWNQRPYLLWDE